MRPEIGALVGTTAVWLFFWAVGGAFGTAAGTASYLDVAAGLGIMAVAVSLLMIGGEFDLSSGAMTGATAMLVIMFSKEVGELGGAGLTLHFAVPLSLAFALMIGWFNGTVVEKTRLPSFIVTLGTFFVLIGAKLGFSKLFSGQVVVEGLNEAAGYGFWRKVFAASWIRNLHIWNDRDIVWTILVIAGVALIAAGVLEMSYRRAEPRNPKGLIGFAVGAAVAFAGFYGLLNSDGVSKNVVNGALVGAGVLVAVLGWGAWRFPPIGRRGPVKLERKETTFVGIGLVLVAASVVLAAMFNPDSQNSVGTLVSDGFARSLFTIGIGVAGVLAVLVAAGKVPVWSPLAGVAIAAIPAVGFLMTRQGVRAVLFVGLAVAGLLLMVVASSRAAAYSASAGLAVELADGARRRRPRVLHPLRVDVGEVPRPAVHRDAPDRAGAGVLGPPRVPVRRSHRAGRGGRQARLARRDHGHPAARRGDGGDDALHDHRRGRGGSGRDALPDLDPVVPPLHRVRDLAADAGPVRQLDLRRRRQQGGRPGRGRPRRRAPRRRCSCSSRGRRGSSAC